MYLNKKGKVPNQAHVGIPDGLCEEEHGRDGFAGPVSHLYRSHPPTGWVRIEGPLKPRAFVCHFPVSADPVLAMQSQDARLYFSHRAHSMSYFLRDSDGDELYFI
ncbi:MAG TPA: homogentisate 1,2-dioxygenase, partial [Nitrospira sp.]|nr:homogentisate 1,2-dioxygenase [Nitrospira sp.]